MRFWQERPFLRIALALPLCVLLLWMSLGVTLNIQLAGSAPALALRWWPAGAEARAGLAGQDLAGRITPADARRGELLARQALAREPVLAVAARLLGVARASLKGEAAADPVFSYAQSLSRRDLPTQLWLIQRGVESGNVSGALGHYDIALRTDETSGDLLLPVLAAASGNSDIARALAPYLHRRPVWTRHYFERLATVASNPVTLFAQARAARLQPAGDANFLNLIVSRLVALGRPDLGRALLGRDYQGMLRDGSFEAGGAFAPFDWSFSTDPDLDASRDTSSDGSGRYVLHVVAKAGGGGEVARQMLLLSVGHYVLAGTAASKEGKTVFQATLACDRSGATVQAAPIPAAWPPRRFAITFDIPPGCSAQWLRLGIPPAQGIDGWVDALSITPGRATAR